MHRFEEIKTSVIEGEEELVVELTQKLLDAGEKPTDIIKNGLIAGMDVVGVQFKNGDVFIPEVLLSASAMNAGIALLKPMLVEGDIPSRGKIVIGTVQGDLHNIGKSLVAMMLESKGYTIFDVGCDVTPETFVRVAQEEKADILAMSSLLTTSMMGMKTTIDLAKAEGLQSKVIVGGAPVSQSYADSIGADGYSVDAATAVDLCDRLLGHA
ncbi:MAG: corrinoid protein [Christensenella sp.]|nr:corrinoid protein [Christensenella sp.]